MLDNGAWGDYVARRPFNVEAFESACAWAAGLPSRSRPAWVVCPDRVAGGLASLEFSLDWLDRRAVAFPGLSWYLAVQDGMSEADVAPHLSRFAGVFIGGELPWKLRAGAGWVRFAHLRGLLCHIGRVGTGRRARWAKQIGADSIDSALPLRSDGNLRAFTRGLAAHQLELL